MQQYLFTLKFDEFSAKLLITGDWSLYELAETVVDAVRFDFDHAFGFYDNVNNPYQSNEKYTLFADMGEPEEDESGVKDTLISDVFEKGKSMLFLFDYGDDWQFLLTCDAVDESKAKRRSRKVTKRIGTPPEQYPDFDEEEDEMDEDEWISVDD